ncbi:hypothetical protein S2L_02 [Cyanophage S-2L]|nr:hypothetical protein S2L_02 [Cyanophage S-2L]
MKPSGGASAQAAAGTRASRSSRSLMRPPVWRRRSPGGGRRSGGSAPGCRGRRRGGRPRSPSRRRACAARGLRAGSRGRRSLGHPLGRGGLPAAVPQHQIHPGDAQIELAAGEDLLPLVLGHLDSQPGHAMLEDRVDVRGVLVEIPVELQEVPAPFVSEGVDGPPRTGVGSSVRSGRGHGDRTSGRTGPRRQGPVPRPEG